MQNEDCHKPIFGGMENSEVCLHEVFEFSEVHSFRYLKHGFLKLIVKQSLSLGALGKKMYKNTRKYTIWAKLTGISEVRSLTVLS